MEVQWRSKTMISASGYSAYQLVFGPSHVDRFGWGNQDEDSIFDQDACLSGQFVQRWKLGMMAQEAALNEVAKRKLRRLFAYETTVNCAEVRTGKAPNRKSAPEWTKRE